VVLQPGPAPPDGDRAQPEKPQRCTERPVAAVDGELRGPQQVGQAHLPVVGMAALAAERVRDPDAGAYASEHLLRHDLAAAGADQVQHAGLGHEHPLPPGLARHPHRGLVAAHHPACADGGLDGLCGGGQRRTGAGQDVVEAALADLQAEHLAHERAQPLEPDGLGVVQGDHHRLDAAAEWRARLEPGWRRGDGARAAAPSAAAEQVHADDVEPDGRQFDAVMDGLRRLRRGGEIGVAVRAGIEMRLDHAVRVLVQGAGCAGSSAALAERLLHGPVRLLAFGRRGGGIAGSLGRLAKPGLQFGDQDGQRDDLIRLRQDQRDQVLFGQPEKVIAVHIRR